MNELSSINEFFSQVGCQFQCYDMSRLIQPLATQTLVEFEQTALSWPTPFMQHAWLAIVFWTPRSAAGARVMPAQEHYVWFLKLPLDEQTKLNLVARDDFLRRLVEALANYLDDGEQKEAREKLESLENAMKDNPYGFQPKQEQMANFHAIVHQRLSLAPSKFYAPVQDYFSGSQDFKHWTQLGYQGFADICARLDERWHDEDNETLISKAVAHLPMSPLQVLSNCLEHHNVSQRLIQAFHSRLLKTLSENTPSAIAPVCGAAIRATAQASDKSLQSQLLIEVLESPARNDIEVLATISGRCWEQLSDPHILTLFLEALAVTEHGQGAFNAIISDLMFIPGMRDIILQSFRSPERSEALAKAIGSFFAQFSQAK